MSSLEPLAKKIKLSLEPSIDNKVVDITNTGQEIYKTETTLPEKLMQSVDRIWFERGEWKHISENSLAADKEEQEEEEAAQVENATQLPPTGYDLVKLRESVINKLFHAKSEIDVALDVINILAAGNRSASNVKDLVLPNGSLTATYVTKPKPTTKAQLESVQLNLGLKRKKQKQASNFLKKSAASLKLLVEKEQVFWDEALDLRRNNWMIQANTAAGSSFYVNYGFSEVGSDFNEASVGELKRAAEKDSTKKVEMSLPHGTHKRVVVNISQSHTGKLGLGQKAFLEGILGITHRLDSSQVDDTRFLPKSQHSEIQNQLAVAHSTVFDAELFSDILVEAQALNSNVRFPDDEIVIDIDGQIDLSIKKRVIGNQVASRMSAPDSVSRTIDLSFRLLLLQHQKFNVWKPRAKIFNPSILQHKKIPSHISILAPVMSLTRFWVQFDRIRHVVHAITHPLRGQGGLNISVHFKFSNSDCLSKLNYQSYPGHGEIAVSLGISLLKGPALHFALNQSGSISVYLPQTTVSLQNVSEFEAFLSRELKVICLTVVCEQANEMIRRSSRYAKATGSDQQRLLWKVDGVDEAIHGSIHQKPHWRNININMTSTSLQFRVTEEEDKEALVYHLNLKNSVHSALNFKERASVIIQKILDLSS